ncbi:iron-sulfur cluster co-chaperone protein HscB, mitochondrial [Cephus cinctus]|uniref:Iron-sulfur cluster co-chaperone protein HscB, mitochondrial n=1 Tax=Cephus cinctus TaxID=211228 RepID=A0AAJ7FJ89_CEPCN|nr:iron-sulfur cluster co-chaperone protein HscB, mitochondrial [Cephus cinctus]
MLNSCSCQCFVVELIKTYDISNAINMKLAARALCSILKLTFNKSYGIRYQHFYTQCKVRHGMSANNLLHKQWYSSGDPSKCWNCKYPYRSELFCSKCKTLQELPKKLNYFEIMGLRQYYDVDNTELQKKYRQLQNLLHPDRYGNKSEKEKQISEDLSSLLNKAYSTLKHPLSRGLYLLQLNNLIIPEGTTNLNNEFLIKIMEKNEEVESAAKDKGKAMKLLEENKEVLEKLSKEASNAFRENDLEKAKVILIQMKYYASIYKRLKDIKNELDVIE